MSEWKEVRLGDVLDFHRGYDLPKSEMENGDVPVAGSNGIIGFHNKATAITPCITIGRSGSIGQPFYYERAWAHNTVLYIDDFKGNNPKFLYYLIKILPISNFAGGSAVPSLNRNHIHPLVIKFCDDIEKQKEIAGILSSLDAKIETNNKLNEKLEEMAQAIFKSWFVDFEPFKDKPFHETELGMIPEGWEVKRLCDIVDNIGGYSYKGNELKESTTAMCTIKNFERNGGFKIDGYKEIIPSDKLKASQELSLFDVVVAHTDLTQNAEVIGNPAIILSKSNYDRIIFSMDLTKVISKNMNVSKSLLYCILRNKRFKNHALGYVNGTTVLHMSKKAVPDYMLAFPKDSAILTSLSKCFDSIFGRMHEIYKENDRLASLRDTLLPRLMSGELIV